MAIKLDRNLIVRDEKSCLNHRITAVIMASGHGKRFGSNKLLENFRGKPVVESVFSELPSELFDRIVVVSIYETVLDIAEKYGFKGVKNDDTSDDTAVTIKKGCEACSADVDGIMFFTGDQPLLKRETIANLIEVFALDRSRIVVPVCAGKRGNPVIFPVSMKQKLASLPPGGRGKDVIDSNGESVLEVTFANSEEFFDIDYKSDLEKAEKLYFR